MTQQYKSDVNWRLWGGVLLLSFIMIAACLIASLGYKATAVEPTIAANNINATNTSFALTPRTATPTITLTPTLPPSPLPPTNISPLVYCPAKVSGGNISLLKYPGYGYKLEALSNNEEVNLIGILDDGWFWVETGKQRGWLKQISLKDFTCTPNEYNLHYMMYPDDQGSQVVLEDTFSKGKYSWQDDQGNLLEIKSNDKESYLLLPYTGLGLITTLDVDVTSLADFHFFSSFSFEKTLPTTSYIGVRFLESGFSYYEADFFPRQCQIIIKNEEDEKLLERKLSSSTCIDKYYNMTLSLTDGEVEIIINDSSFSYIPNQLSGSEYGGVRLVINDATVQMDHVLVLTALK